MRHIENILKQWKKESGCSGGILFKYSYSDGILSIYSGYPGYLIGKAGCHVFKYTEICKDKILGFTNFNFVQTERHVI